MSEYNTFMPQSPTDVELVAAFRGGNSSARDTLVSRYYGLTYTLCSQYARKLSNVEGDDLLSYGLEGLMKAVELWSDDGGMSFKNFVVTKVNFGIIDGLREDNKTRQAKKYGVTFNQFGDFESEGHGDGRDNYGANALADRKSVDPEQVIFSEQIWNIINRSHCGLDKQILNGYFRYGMTMGHIGSRIGVTESCISQNIKAALVEVKRRITYKYAKRQRKNYPAVPVCLMDRCDDKYHRSGLCELHYKRFQSHKQLDLVGIKVASGEVVEHCHFHGCKSPHFRLHFCHSHWLEWKRDHGELKKCGTSECDVEIGSGAEYCESCASKVNTKRRRQRTCTREGCERKVYGGELCWDHYKSADWRKDCVTEGCPRKADCKGICNACYLKKKLADRGHQKCRMQHCRKVSHRNKLCREHYMIDRARRGFGSPCSEPNCGEPVSARGMCQHHYDKAKRASKKDPCSADGCERLAVHSGYCNHHRRVLRAFYKPSSIKPCSEAACEKNAYCKGLCTMHYFRAKVASKELIGA